MGVGFWLFHSFVLQFLFINSTMFFSPVNRFFLISIDYTYIQPSYTLICCVSSISSSNKLTLENLWFLTSNQPQPTIQPSNHLQKKTRNPHGPDLDSFTEVQDVRLRFFGDSRTLRKDRTVGSLVPPWDTLQGTIIYPPQKMAFWEDDDFRNFPRVGYVNSLLDIFRDSIEVSWWVPLMVLLMAEIRLTSWGW